MNTQIYAVNQQLERTLHFSIFVGGKYRADVYVGFPAS